MYFLKHKGKENIDSGVAIYRHAGSSWKLVAHPSKPLRRNLGSSLFFYSASLRGGGEYKLYEGTGLQEPEQAATVNTEIHFTLVGKFGGGGKSSS